MIHYFLFFFIQIFTFRTLQKTNWRTQPLDIIWFHEFFWQMKINFSNKKKNNSDLQVSSWKVFYQNHMLFVFVFLSYMNNQQSVPKFNSSVWPGPTEKTVSLFCSTSIRLWNKDQILTTLSRNIQCEIVYRGMVSQSSDNNVS